MTEPTRITPRTLKGFRDYLPETMIPRERLIDTARRVYRSYGFSPIDTPALEYLEILAGKGSEETDKQLYKFQDHGGRWVGLRFDLTVPLARFAAQHVNELGVPFKRYHIATVWRGENTQRGRYREFMQCDFDTIGTRSIAADIETALVIHDLFRAIGFADFTIRINNRMVLIGPAGTAWPCRIARRPFCGRWTSWARSAPEAVAEEMVSAAGATAEQARQVLRLSEIAGGNDEVLRQVEPLVAGSETGQAGVAKLKEVLDGAGGGRRARRAGAARSVDRPRTGLLHRHGLRDFLDALPGIGSVCSGGRYDNLAELVHLAGVAGHRRLAGTGPAAGGDGRVGHDREDLDAGPGASFRFSTRTACTIICAWRRRCGRRASASRSFPMPKKLGQQLKYADRRGFRIALIAGGNEFQSGVCQVKDLQTGEKQDVPLEPTRPASSRR